MSEIDSNEMARIRAALEEMREERDGLKTSCAELQRRVNFQAEVIIHYRQEMFYIQANAPEEFSEMARRAVAWRPRGA